MMHLLGKENYRIAAEEVKKITINNLFARVVTEEKIDGKIYVDNPENPTTFYIVHPYGMTLLLGKSDNAEFNQSFKRYALNLDDLRSQTEWVQTFPRDWDNVIPTLFNKNLNKQLISKGIIEQNTRLNFKFNITKYQAHHKNIDDNDIKIVKVDRTLYGEMKGNVIPSYFWKNEDDFIENGLAYALLYQNQLASMAFSSCWLDNLFEIGIETKPKFRGKGFAELVCSALIEYCLNNKLEPIWACRKENTGSQKLAIKLGFEISGSLPYYKLSN